MARKASDVDDFLARATKQRWSPRQILEHLAETEAAERAHRSLERRLRLSEIKKFKPMADFDWSWPKKIERDVIERALTLDFFPEARNLVLVGTNGLGKTMIAQNIHFNGTPYGVGVDVEGLCNGADFPMLGVKIATNLYTGFGTDHQSSPSSWDVWKRIDEAAWAATDRAAQPDIGALLQPAGRRNSQHDRRRRRDRFSTAGWCRRNDRKGRLIRHARPAPALAILLLTIPVVEPAFQTLLIAAVGRPVLPAPGFGAAHRAAIALSAIAMRTNPEHRLTSLAAANALPENYPLACLLSTRH